MIQINSTCNIDLKKALSCNSAHDCPFNPRNLYSEHTTLKICTGILSSASNYNGKKMYPFLQKRCLPQL